MLDDRPPSSVSVLFALSPIARATLALAVVAVVLAVVLLVGSPGSTPVIFRAELASICNHWISIRVCDERCQRRSAGVARPARDRARRARLRRSHPAALGFEAAERRSSVLSRVRRRARSGGRGWTTLANAARAGHTAQLAAIESVINAPFAYAKSEGLGCTKRDARFRRRLLAARRAAHVRWPRFSVARAAMARKRSTRLGVHAACRLPFR